MNEINELLEKYPDYTIIFDSTVIGVELKMQQLSNGQYASFIVNENDKFLYVTKISDLLCG